MENIGKEYIRRARIINGDCRIETARIDKSNKIIIICEESESYGKFVNLYTNWGRVVFELYSYTITNDRVSYRYLEEILYMDNAGDIMYNIYDNAGLTIVFDNCVIDISIEKLNDKSYVTFYAYYK